MFQISNNLLVIQQIIHISTKETLKTDILQRGCYLLEILHTSPTVKTSKNVVKSGYFNKLLQWRAQISFCQMKEACNFSCVKIFLS